MRRLLETPEHEDSTERELADLFASIAPTASDALRKRRVRANVRMRLSRHGLPGAPRRVKWAIVGGVLVLGTAAAAMVGHGMFRGSTVSPAVLSSDSSVNAPKPNRIEPTAPVVVSGAVNMNESGTAVDAVSKTDGKPNVRGPLNVGEDPTLVAEAIRALRTNNDPARARNLLNEYLKNNPHGALVADALALSIEAADAQGDPKAASLGCKYMAAYPNGRYRALASRACEKARQQK